MPCPSPWPGLAKAARRNAARTARRAVRIMRGLSSYVDSLLPVEGDGLGTGELGRRARGDLQRGGADGHGDLAGAGGQRHVSSVVEALRAEGGRKLHGPCGSARRLDARRHRRIGNGLTGCSVRDEGDEPALALALTGAVLVFRVIAVALRSDRKEGEPDAVAACGLLARLVLCVARVVSLA